MNNEQKILNTLELVVEKLNDHSNRFDMLDNRLDTMDSRLDTMDSRLDTMDNRLDTMDNRLDAMDNRLDAMDNRLDTMDNRLETIEQRLDTMDVQLKEHGEHLSALRTGQEFLKAELDGMKIANAKEFGNIKQQMDEYTLNFGLLRDEVWEQKVHIERIKKTMGMA